MWKLKARLEQQSGDGGGGGGGGDWRTGFGTEGATALKDFAQPGDFLKAFNDRGAELTTLKGAAAKPWHGESHKDYVTNKGFKSGDDVITSLQNAEKLIGAERAGRTVVLPKDEKDAEGIKAFRSKIGVPESADKYELPLPAGQDGAFAAKAAQWFFDHGVPKAAAQGIAKAWNDHMTAYLAEGEAAEKAESTKQLDALKGKWGTDFDKRAEEARRFMKASGWDDAKVARYEAAFGTADMLETFQALGAKLGEGGFVKGDGQGHGGMTPQAAKDKLNEYRLQRIDGKISDADWQRYQELYGPIAEQAKAA